MSTVPNYYLIETSTQSLVNFFADATAVGLSEFYKAQHECTLARYALRDKTLVYDTLRTFLQEQAKTNPKEAFLLLGKLDQAADRLVLTVDKVVGLLKKAAEIDILTSTRFDGIQLYHLIQQIPTVIVTLITEVLETQCELFCESILDTVPSLNGSGDTIRRQIKEQIPVFAASVAKEITDRLAIELESKLKVVTVDAVAGGVNGGANNNSSASSAVEESRVAGMLGTVPEYNATGESDAEN